MVNPTLFRRIEARHGGVRCIEGLGEPATTGEATYHDDVTLRVVAELEYVVAHL
jgi:hypothetical protein